MTKKIADSYDEQKLLIDPTKPLLCYRNLNRRLNGEAGFFSVKQGAVVIFHCRQIFLKDVEFVVNEKQRQRVLASRQKNVHAFVKGYLSPPISFTEDETYYNPYKQTQFQVGTVPIYKAEFCRLVRQDKMRVFASQTCVCEAVENHLL